MGEDLEALQGQGYQIEGRIWIEGKEGTFLGYGRVVLLEKIRDYGSIRKAASSMGMAYRQAWRLVESMNRQAKKPLVKTMKGGRGGGGARLTPEGERAIKIFWEIYQKFNQLFREESKGLNF